MHDTDLTMVVEDLCPPAPLTQPWASRSRPGLVGYQT
jgi:hypothetical protein